MLPAPVTEVILGIGFATLVGVHALNQTLSFAFYLGVFALSFYSGIGVGGEAFGRALNRGAVVASVGVLLIAVGGFAVARVLGEDSRVALYIALALVPTSIGVGARQFHAHGAFAKKAAQISLAAALVDDFYGLAALVVLGLLVGVSSKHSSGAVALTVVLSVALPVGLVVLSRVIHTSRARATAAVISITAVALCLLHQVSPVVAGFFLGISLERMGYASSKRVLALSGQATEFLAPLFFFLAGFGFSVSALASGAVWVLSGGLLLALVVSRIACALAAPGPRLDRLVVGAAMLPRAEVTLVIIRTAVAAGVFAPREYSAVLIIVVVGMAASAALLSKWLGYPSEGAS